MNESVSSSTDATPPNAGLGKRFAAMFYDGMLLIGVLFVATFALSAAFGGWEFTTAPVEGDTVHELQPVLSGLPFQLYLLAIIYLFNSYFWWKSGQTLGMQSWRLKLVSDDGGGPDWRQCSLRWLVAMASLLALGLGYWWALWQKDSRTWHDLASGTHVVQLPKPA